MKKSKIILLYSFYIVVLFYTLYINCNKIVHSKYQSETEIYGIINKYSIQEDYIKLEVKGKEKIICNYYLNKSDDIKNISKKIKLGQSVYLKGELTLPKKNTNFNLFNYQNYLLSKKINWIFKIEKIQFVDHPISIKYKIKNSIVDKIDNDEYLGLFILGENNLDTETNDNYRMLGISHLFAISGMHITLLTGFLNKILNKFLKNKKLVFIIIVLFLLFYMFLTNYTPSVIRASMLFIIINIKKIINFKITNDNVLLLILSVLLIYNPYYIYDLGFLFSFTISYTLIKFNYLTNKYNNYFVSTFITSLISFVVSIPIMILGFNQINILSPLFNMIFVPFVSLVVFPISLLSFFIPILSYISNILIFLMEFSVDIFSNIKSCLIILPSVPLYMLFLYYIVIYFVIKKMNFKRILILFLIIIIHSNINYLNRYPILTMIDVGQGDSILIELPHNKGNILIDTGGIVNYGNKTNKYSISKSIIIPYLKSVGIKKIDYLILTHGDYDHVGEALELINNYRVSNVILNSGNNNDIEINILKKLKEKNIPFMNVSKYELKINEYKLSFINKKNNQNENEDSLITHTNLNNRNILLMGDAGIPSENYLINEYNLKKVHIIKVGHHGSKYSSSANFINEIKPDISLISVGLNNRFNHPTKEALENLKNSSIYLTSINGMIKIILKDEMEIYTCINGLR